MKLFKLRCESVTPYCNPNNMNTAIHPAQVPAAATAAGKTILPAQEPLPQAQPDTGSQPLSISCKLTVGAPNDSLEHEADAMADKVMRMPDSATAGAEAPLSSAPPSIQRFSDDDHHVIDESALAGVFDEMAIHSIEQGNKQRDYSQSPALLNALLLGAYQKFGGYKDYEHFDNFVWDREHERWISRNEWDKIWDDNSRQWVPRLTPQPPGPQPRRKTPVQYIEEELLAAVEHTPPLPGDFTRMGNAFHTIEDFFAHSNFLELTQHDTSFGEELTTGSVGSQDNTSLYSITSHVTSGITSDIYHNKFLADQAASSDTSHAKIAKDYPTNKNHQLAILLASLVINETALSLKSIATLPGKAERQQAVRELVMQRLQSYLRPPSEKNKWWERLLQNNGDAMRARNAENRARTTVTENQYSLSPLRALEANRLGDVRALGNLQVVPELVRFLYKARNLNLLSLNIDDFPLPSVSVPIGRGNDTFLTFGRLYNFPGLGSINNQSLDDSSQSRLIPPFPLANPDKNVTPFLGISIEGTTDFLSGR